MIARILTILSTLLLYSCANIPVSQDYDQEFDFATLHHYQWLAEQHQVAPTAASFAIKEPLIDKRIRRAIEHNLQGLKYEKSAASPDFYVTYHSLVESKIKSRPATITIGTGYYGRYGGFNINTGSEVHQYDERKLTIDVLDRQHQVIWRGTSTSTVREHTNPQQVTELINQSVGKILKQFPPK